MMVHVEHSEYLLFGGNTEPCAIIQVEAIGGVAEDIMLPLTEVILSTSF
jgi:hypothetical protein